MRKFLFVGAVGVFFAVGNGVVGAETPVKTEHAIDLRIGGSIDLGAVYRNQAFQNVYYGPYHRFSPQSVSRPDGAIAQGRRIVPFLTEDNGSLFVIDPQLSLHLKATMRRLRRRRRIFTLAHQGYFRGFDLRQFEGIELEVPRGGAGVR